MSRFISYLLFFLTVVAAVSLAGLVLTAPWLTDIHTEPPIWERLFRLFADDATVRRTALASALGLFVTAWVFFRPARPEAKVVANSKNPSV